MKPKRWVARFFGFVALGLVGLAWLRRDEILRFFTPRVDFAVKAGEWPMRHGGPSRNATSDAPHQLPDGWDVDAKTNVLWTAELGSQSFGDAVVAGGRVFIGTNNERERNPKIAGDRGVLLCLRSDDGKFVWQATHAKLPTGRINDWPFLGIASSPVVQGDRLWYVSNRCELVCADVDGFHDGTNDGPFTDEVHADTIDADFVWVLDMIGELGVFPHNLACSSPAVHGPYVYVVTGNGVDQRHVKPPNPTAPSFIAVDKRTGELRWQRSDPGVNVLHGSWSSPTLGVAGDGVQVVFPGGDGWLYSFEPNSGELLWKFDGNPKGARWALGGLGTKNNILAPVSFVDEHVFLAMGQDPEHGDGRGALYSIDASGRGDVTETHAKWRVASAAINRSMSTPVVAGDLVFSADTSGFLHCLDRETGSIHWTHDLMAGVWGTPLVADGKVFVGDEDGDVAIFEASSTLVLIAETNVENSVYGSPIVADGVLYVVTRNRLLAISLR